MATASRFRATTQHVVPLMIVCSILSGCAREPSSQRVRAAHALLGNWCRDSDADARAAATVPTMHVLVLADTRWRSLVFVKSEDQLVRWEFDGGGTWRVEEQQLVLEYDLSESPNVPPGTADRWEIVDVNHQQLVLTQGTGEPIVFRRAADIESWILERALAERPINGIPRVAPVLEPVGRSPKRLR
jgi:hypothetical protein